MANDIFNTKKLGFGLMRLPKKPVTIDVEQTKRMVDAFLDAGFTYFDTAYVYLGSENAARKALVERHPRESYTLASKLNAGVAPTARAAKYQLTTTLKRTGAGYIDYYLLHNVQPAHYNDHRAANTIEDSIYFAAKRHVGQRMIF